MMPPLWQLPMQESPRETVATLVELTKLLHHTISYQRREEGAAQAPAETLRLRRGACRDTAVLLAENLRDAGLAARVVSGYLRETDEEIRRAEGSLHAWTEVFLPGAGWVALDPTLGRPPSERETYFAHYTPDHIIVTMGRNPSTLRGSSYWTHLYWPGNSTTITVDPKEWQIQLIN